MSIKLYLMKKILLILFVFGSFLAKAQNYNNEWIDYNKTYYKFKVAVTGLYRISQPSLSTIGLGSIPAEQFQLWRNGKEIPLYTTVQTGPMSGSDYIEFWGEMNDGKPDNDLYRQSQFQLSDKWSLQTDTAAFFLTVNPSGNNLRLIPTPNDVAGNLLPPEPYFMHTVGQYWRSKINPGFYQDVGGAFVYSSSYDQNEGWTSGDVDSAGVLSTPFTNLYVYNSGPTPTLSVNLAGNAPYQRNFRVSVNGTNILQQPVDYFDYVKAQQTFALSLITSGSATVDITNLSTAHPDRLVIAQLEVNYPRQFNFGNTKNFYFELPANTNGNYLEISNFNYGSTAPVLYDLTNGRRYVADITNPALIKIALLPSSVNRKLLLVSEDASNILAVNSFQQRNFVNLTLAANQGDYLIISNTALNNASDGSHPIDDYQAYRSSAAGSSYNVKIYWIDDLVDQFGFGIKMHPLSIRNFLRWARANFSMQLKDVLLIGKGITYTQFRTYESDANINNLFFIPTFGQPASDQLLSAAPGSSIPLTPIGRLSVISGNEIEIYLNKLKEYEQTQAFSSPLIADKSWMKNIVHIVGASDPVLGQILGTYMDKYKQIAIDTLFGAHVTTFSNNSPDVAPELSNTLLHQLFEQGISLFTYFGHSSSTVLDFNLEAPEQYNNPGKYPVMLVMGCNAGNFFNYNTVRLVTKETLSEQFLLAQQRGAIAFVASTSTGVVPYLDQYNFQAYTAACRTKYGKTFGEVMDEACRQILNAYPFDFYARFHCEQATLNGDPALKLNTFAKPDYAIEDPLVKISPSFVSVGDGSFKVDAKMLNLGKAINNRIVIETKRTYPDNSTSVIRLDTINGIRYSDSLSFNVPINAIRDKGLNKITITIDPNNEVDELYKSNNSISKDVFIYEDEARPIYPYDFAIMNTQNFKLIASTANPFAPVKQYTIEIDTTEFFNSPFKVTKTISSAGGEFEVSPGIAFTDSTVYYWRVAPVPTSGQPVWNEASFVYLSNSDYGFNQSHFYQHLKSSAQRVYLDSSSRLWKFGKIFNNLFIRNGVFPTAASQATELSVAINGNDGLIRSVCGLSNVIFNVFDSLTFKPWFNGPAGNAGLYGSDPICGGGREYNFQYNILDTNKRRKIVEFMDMVPNGDYVVVRNTSGTNPASNTYANDWKNDTTYLGPGNSMYLRLLQQGFTGIDSFYKPRAWIFVYKKNSSGSFTPQFIFSNDIYDPINLSVDCITSDTLGFVTSPVFGPAKAWKQLKWRGTNDVSDVVSLDIIGVRNDGTEVTQMSGLDLSQQDFDISSISASVYPFVKLKLKVQDSVNLTPYQLRYWRLTYVPAPEGAIAPNIFLKTKDTIDVGEPLDFKVAFKNVSPVAFDSMKLKIVVTDKNNVPNIIPLSRRRPLQPADDTLQVGGVINTTRLAGLNSLYLEVNPDNDQPEQYHFNNFLYRNFYTRPDTIHPLMDVTFDGVHILNEDIVSSKPAILVKLKDESKWMILDDTSLLTVQVKYPDGSLRRFYFNNDTLRFTPAAPAPNTDNTAAINFAPYFPQDGEYQLIVTGKDRSNNSAGNIEYRVVFEIINKPMISNMMNYPNPFTTSTAFVFTITGSEVPQNIKIEILTITGKIVREITKDELGPLHIGRNITEFKWDGTDMYGQKLANGIYLYRVVTNLNGRSLDKYKASGDETDKYFNKGYGKMYLMR